MAVAGASACRPPARRCWAIHEIREIRHTVCLLNRDLPWPTNSRAGDLEATIGDNAAAGEHRAGYNGVWKLVHRAEPTNLFVPTVAGLNFEHIFDGDKGDVDASRRVFFEPRNAPMTLRKISDVEVELHQPPTPTFHLESWTQFRLSPPHQIDFSFRCRATQQVFAHGYIGLFWASYINAPDDRSMYFRGANAWQQVCTQRHNDQSTVRFRDDPFELKFRPGLGDALYKNLSPHRFDEPFFYGHFHGMTVIFMFDRSAGIRFTHSPSGGGFNRERETNNPAWDFQFIVPKYDVLVDYSFRGRLTYRPRCARREIQAEYHLRQLPNLTLRPDDNLQQLGHGRRRALHGVEQFRKDNDRRAKNKLKAGISHIRIVSDRAAFHAAVVSCP